MKTATRVSRKGLIALTLASMFATGSGTMAFFSIVDAADITTIGKSGATATKAAVRVDPP